MYALSNLAYPPVFPLHFPQFDYDNGFGEQLGRFKIDLYKAQGPGDCGTWVTSICDKPEMGCHDSRESAAPILL